MTFPGFPSALLARQAVRETARATADMVMNKITKPTYVGATVTEAAAPGTGVVSVHLDGDVPGKSVAVACDWFLYRVGQRVLVLQFPPSGAFVVSADGPPEPWIDYPSDVAAWTSQQHNTPTINTLQSGGDFPGSVSSYEVGSNVDPQADTLLVLCIGWERQAGTGTEVADVTNTGIPLLWTRRVSASGNIHWQGSGGHLSNVEIWTAYNHQAQSNIDVEAIFDAALTPAPLIYALLECENADELQLGAGTGSSDGDAYDPYTCSVTTTVDRSQVVGVGVGSVDTGGALNTFAIAASAGCNLVVGYPPFPDAAFRWAGVVRRSSGVTNPGATTVGLTGDGAGTHDSLLVGLEIIGTPDTPSIGDGQLVASYRVYDKTMHLGVVADAGASTDYGGGPIVLQLPPGFRASSRKAVQSIGGVLLPTGASGNLYRLQALILAGETKFFRTLYQDGSTQALDATHPVALGASTLLYWGGAIEID